MHDFEPTIMPNPPIVTLVFPCGEEQHIIYDINRIGIKGRKHNGKRPVKAIIRGKISEYALTSITSIMHPNIREIIYE